jgi:hypothetical protein
MSIIPVAGRSNNIHPAEKKTSRQISKEEGGWRYPKRSGGTRRRGRSRRAGGRRRRSRRSRPSRRGTANPSLASLPPLTPLSQSPSRPLRATIRAGIHGRAAAVVGGAATARSHRAGGRAASGSRDGWRGTAERSGVGQGGRICSRLRGGLASSVRCCLVGWLVGWLSGCATLRLSGWPPSCASSLLRINQ